MKLPVFRAVSETLAFSRRFWLDLLRIVWLPNVIGYAVTIGSGYLMVRGAQSADPSEAVFLVLGMMLLWTVVYVIVFAGILRLVIEGDKPRLPFYLGFGAHELRLLATWVLYILIFIGVYFGFSLVFGVVMAATFASVAGDPMTAGSVLMTVGAIASVFFCWFILRLSLSTPASIGRQTVGIGPGWTITKGNVWRLLGFWLILGALLIAAQTLVSILLVPGYLQALIELMTSLASGAWEEAGDAVQTLIIGPAQTADYSLLWLARFIISTIVGLISGAVLAVAGGIAWRLMTEEERPEKHFE